MTLCHRKLKAVLFRNKTFKVPSTKVEGRTASSKWTRTAGAFLKSMVWSKPARAEQNKADETASPFGLSTKVDLHVYGITSLLGEAPLVFLSWNFCRDGAHLKSAIEPFQDIVL